MPAPVVQVQNLKVCFGPHEVLHGIDFTVGKGEFVSIVGKSGGGKSSLLYALAGFVKREGDVQIPDHIGMVFQDYAVFPWLTVKRNIAFGLQAAGNDSQPALLTQYLELTGLTDHARKYPSQLSGGQRQRVALARALAPNPEIILMDEPFGALDPHTRDKMQAWLLEVWEKNHKTVLFVTHNIDEAVFLSDRVIVLNAGRILKEFKVDFARPRNESLKFASDFIEMKKQIFNAIEEGAPLP